MDGLRRCSDPATAALGPRPAPPAGAGLPPLARVGHLVLFPLVAAGARAPAGEQLRERVVAADVALARASPLLPVRVPVRAVQALARGLAAEHVLALERGVRRDGRLGLGLARRRRARPPCPFLR